MNENKPTADMYFRVDVDLVERDFETDEDGFEVPIERLVQHIFSSYTKAWDDDIMSLKETVLALEMAREHECE